MGPLTFIAPGGVHYWWYHRSGGADFGYQHASADIKIPNGGDRLDASDQGKRKFNSGYTQYYVTIRNVDAGTSGVWYNLQGGGAA
ncbi:MAG: hypothetical protein ACRD96_13405 [Bryobacteraceae bacterium]